MVGTAPVDAAKPQGQRDSHLSTESTLASPGFAPDKRIIPSPGGDGSSPSTVDNDAHKMIGAGKAHPSHHSDHSDSSESGEIASSDLEQGKQQQQQQQSNKAIDGDRRFIQSGLRQHFWEIWKYKDPPPPPPASMEDAKEIPLAKANIISIFTYSWMTPIMMLGYRRALEKEDLWALDHSRSAEVVSLKFAENWERRVAEAKEYNEKLTAGTIKPGMLRRSRWAVTVAANRCLPSKYKPKPILHPNQALTMNALEQEWRSPPPAPPKQKLAKSPSSGPAAGGKPGPPPPPPKLPPSRSGYKQPSLARTTWDQFGSAFMLSLLFKLFGDATQICAPLVVRQIIVFGQKRYAYAKWDYVANNGPPPFENPHIGKGIGLSFALFFMQIGFSLFAHQAFYRSMQMGVMLRAALISAMFRRSLSLASKDRSAGKLLGHTSTDISRIQFAADWLSNGFSAPFGLALCLGLLIWQIGPAALVGFALLVVSMPIQAVVMSKLFAIRKQSMRWTDKRQKLIQECLVSIRTVKYFNFESRFLARLQDYRRLELKSIRQILIVRAGNQSVAFAMPVLASVLSFIVYTLLGHPLNAANIFTALTLFNLLRLPLMFLPLCLSATVDAASAFQRLYGVFTAEQMPETTIRDPSAPDALKLVDASFIWEEVKVEQDELSSSELKKQKAHAKKAAKAEQAAAGNGNGKRKSTAFSDALSSRRGSAALSTSTDGPASPTSRAHVETEANAAEAQGSQAAGAAQVDPSTVQSALAALQGEMGTGTEDELTDEPEHKPFKLSHLNLTIPRGKLIGIVGPVGCGKSSLLQGCLGEMRKTSGSVTWGTKEVAYCSQTAWIMSATVRDNIVFGQPWDPKRYEEAIKLSELTADLVMLPAGDETEIGERGVNLSGGQKQRINIARALYFDPDIFCFDDPLSALDAHVGKAVFENAIMGLRRRGKTVLLVTHALHFLPDMDTIMTMTADADEGGRIAEMGTYEELSNAKGAFSRLIEEFGGEREREAEEAAEKEADQAEEEERAIESGKLGLGDEDSSEAEKEARAALDVKERQERAKAGALMQAEERNTGSVSWDVIAAYLRAGKGHVLIPLVVASLVAMQATQVLSSYWIVWWEQRSLGLPTGGYIGIYAMLGINVAVTTFAMGTITGYLSFYACQGLHHDAMRRVMYAPMSWFDSTPVGRITNRFGKDVDVVDNQLSDALRMFISTLSNVFGAAVLITILTKHYSNDLGNIFYRASARECKRIDAMLRSGLYSHFAETLSGLATIRAYYRIPSFLAENYKRMDHENRALLLTTTNQRWLGVRLDLLGGLLTFIVAILSTAAATSLSPGQVGVALSYILSVSQSFSWMVRQFAEAENDFSSAERLQHYAERLDQEAPHEVPEHPVPASWPAHGQIKIENLHLRYRPELPDVLKGVNLDISAGSKIAVVGRTGAGKSTLLAALLRMVETPRGKVIIDGVDISQIGLSDLRRRIALLPQDPLLFSGTIRSNLDPFSQYDDQRLWDALRRAELVDGEYQSGAATPANDLTSEKEKGVDQFEHGDDEKKISRFTLDTPIEDEGLNLSLGQRSLVSLARALVKDAQICLLDEATASIDQVTDKRIQKTIRVEFASKTLICIAHRLRTIIGYDAVAVFSEGRVAEYDSPLVLFDRPNGIFRGMCERSGIGREDIIRAQRGEDL
ncbi:hypothetical protein OC846_005775 [Tilletia horrida]|uniref:Oligomycin resistance ATP-dependent permease YOR1 n=1 Tax=Tilletia horrida TaxID=155126 RepID=A0AAN6GK45_9BASI|nr:hypothetical protein OC846_005775 [Tilletia horrida]KAK0562127.1 hypothetical protein OC861_005479 [Tilletia horrida]